MLPESALTSMNVLFATPCYISNVQGGELDVFGRGDQELTEGLAAVVALAQPVLLPGQPFAVRAGWGAYDDSNAVGFSVAGVVAKNLLSRGRGGTSLG